MATRNKIPAESVAPRNLTRQPAALSESQVVSIIDSSAVTEDLAAHIANTTDAHAASAISGFSEAVDDRVASLLTAGTNITLTYNDGAGTLTIDATGGGGTVDSTIIDGSTNAVSGNAVHDALVLKAPIASPTFTGTVTAPNLTIDNTTFDGYSSSGDALKLTASTGGAVFAVQNSDVAGFSGIEYHGSDGAAKVFTGYNNGNAGEFRFNNFSTGGFIVFKIAGTDKLLINNNGTITLGSLIGTGTRAIGATSAGVLTDIDTSLVHIAGTETITGNKTFSGNTTLANITLDLVTIDGYDGGDALKITGANDGAVLGIQNSNSTGYSGIEYIGSDGAVKVFSGYNNGVTGEFRFNNFAPSGYIAFKIAGTDKLVINNNGTITLGSLSGTGDRAVFANASGVLSTVAVDTTPTNGSSNLIDSNGVFDALATKATKSATSYNTGELAAIDGSGDIESIGITPTELGDLFTDVDNLQALFPTPTTFTPALALSAGSVTYTVQTGHKKIANGIAMVTGRIVGTAGAGGATVTHITGAPAVQTSKYFTQGVFDGFTYLDANTSETGIIELSSSSSNLGWSNGFAASEDFEITFTVTYFTA